MCRAIGPWPKAPLTAMDALSRADGGGSPEGPKRSAGAAQRLDAPTAVRHPARASSNRPNNPGNLPPCRAKQSGKLTVKQSAKQQQLDQPFLFGGRQIENFSWREAGTGAQRPLDEAGHQAPGRALALAGPAPRRRRLGRLPFTLCPCGCRWPSACTERLQQSLPRVGLAAGMGPVTISANNAESCSTARVVSLAMNRSLFRVDRNTVPARHDPAQHPPGNLSPNRLTQLINS